MGIHGDLYIYNMDILSTVQNSGIRGIKHGNMNGFGVRMWNTTNNWMGLP